MNQKGIVIVVQGTINDKKTTPHPTIVTLVAWLQLIKSNGKNN